MGSAQSGAPQMTESVFRVLAALGEPRHGYGIMQRVKEESDGAVVLGPATLYAALTQLEAQGYIRRTGEPEDARGKKTYLITDPGRAALAAEATRLEALARTGFAAARKGGRA
jgi:DNA-binding PadR family transcriptional regulator